MAVPAPAIPYPTTMPFRAPSYSPEGCSYLVGGLCGNALAGAHGGPSIRDRPSHCGRTRPFAPQTWLDNGYLLAAQSRPLKAAPLIAGAVFGARAPAAPVLARLAAYGCARAGIPYPTAMPFRAPAYSPKECSYLVGGLCGNAMADAHGGLSIRGRPSHCDKTRPFAPQTWLDNGYLLAAQSRPLGAAPLTLGARLGRKSPRSPGACPPHGLWLCPRRQSRILYPAMAKDR